MKRYPGCSSEDVRAEEIEQLLKKLTGASEPEKIPILLQLSQEYHYDSRIALEYAELARELAIRHDLKPCHAYALIRIIEIKISQGAESETMNHLEDLTKIPSDEFSPNLLGEIASISSRLYYMNASFTKAVHDHYQAIGIFEEHNLTDKMVNHLKQIGILASNRGDIRTGLDLFNRCLALCNQNENKECIGEILNNIGVIYQNLEEYEKSITYHEQGLSIAKEISNSRLIVVCTANIGNNYHNLHQLKIAMQYYEQSLEEAIRIDNRSYIALLNGSIGRLHHEMKNYSDAFRHLSKSISIYQAIQNKNGIILVTTALAKLYMDPKFEGYLPQESIHLLQQIEQQYEDKIEMPKHMEVFKILSKAYEKQGDFAKAYEHLKSYIQMKEQLDSVKRSTEPDSFYHDMKEEEASPRDDTAELQDSPDSRASENEDLLSNIRQYGSMSISIGDMGIREMNRYLPGILGYKDKDDMDQRFDLKAFLENDENHLLDKLRMSGRLDEVEITWKDTGKYLSINGVLNRENQSVFILVRDVSEHHQLMKRLQRTQSLIKSIVNTLPPSIFWKKIDGTLLGYNKSFSDMIGNEPKVDEVIPLEDMWPFEDFSKFSRLNSKLAAQAESIIKHPVLERLKSGEDRWMEYTLMPVADSTANDEILVIIEDVTELRSLLKQVQDSESKYRTLFESSSDAIMILDREEFVDCNLQTVRMFRYDSKAEFLGLHPSAVSPPLQFHGENSYTLAMMRIEEAFTRGYAKFEWLHQRKNGETFNAEVWLARFNVNDRDVLQATVRDITQAKLDAKSLIEARNKADQASMAKSEFIASMSHEMRTPFHTILGFSDLLYDAIEDAQLREYISAIKTSGNNLLHIINEMLDLSRIEAGLFKLDARPFSIGELIRESIEISGIKTHNQNLEIVTKIDPNIPDFIIMDSARLKQVLLNLMSNAGKFTRKGSITVEAKTENVRHNRLDLILSVEDTGIGIHHSNLGKIFDPFFQIKTNHASPFKGSGLGLAITRKFTEMMGGKIHVRSKVESGTRFDLSFRDVLICKDIDNFLCSDRVNPSAYDFEPTTVLVADNSRKNRQLIQNALKDTPLSIIEADNSGHALWILSHQKNKIVLYDVELPPDEPETFIANVRNNPEIADTIVIAISVAMPGMSDEYFTQIGFNGLLAKPFTEKELLQELHRALK